MTHKNLFSLTPAEEKALQSCLKNMNLQQLINGFYDHFTQHPDIAPFFANRDINDLKNKQVSHWVELFNPEKRAHALKHSETIGDIHQRLKIAPDYYLSGYSFVFTEALEQAIQGLPLFKNKDLRHVTISALSKVLMADITSSLEAYIAKNDVSASQQAQTKMGEGIIDLSVTACMDMNHLFIDCLKGINAATNVDQRVQSISAAMEEMTATVEAIKNNAQNVMNFTHKTSQSAADGRTVSDQAMQTMLNIYKAVEDTSAKAEHLSESSKKIEGIITQINDIAEQTNLLALNATIEAARAGEAGKGFAVVANEVKSLSSETSKATQEITSIIDGLVKSIHDIVGALKTVGESVNIGKDVTEQVKGHMDEIENNAQQVNARMNDVSHSIQEQSAAAAEISTASTHIMKSSAESRQINENNAALSRAANAKVMDLISTISDTADKTSSIIIKLAKSDHIAWKRKISDMILSNTELDPSELKDHTQCRLGKWYYDVGIKEFGAEDIFKKLEEPHARIHKVGREIYEAHKNKNRDVALKKLDDMERISLEVVDLLNQLDAKNSETA